MVSPKNHWRPEDNRMLTKCQEKRCQMKIPYPVKIYFRNGGEIKAFSGREKLGEFMSSGPTVQEKLHKFFSLSTKDTRSKQTTKSMSTRKGK